MDEFTIFLTHQPPCLNQLEPALGGCWGGGLTYTSLSIAVQHKLHVTRTLGAVVRLLADVLATAVAVVTSHYQRAQS